MAPKWSTRARLLVAAGALATVLLGGAALEAALDDDPAPRPLPVSELEGLIRAGEVRSADLSDATRTAEVTTVDGDRRVTTFPDGYGADLARRLVASGADVDAAPRDPDEGRALELATRLLPILAVAGIMLWLLRRSGGGGVGGFARGRGEPVVVPGTGFGDVAGCDEAVAELSELVAHLREPGRLRALGARAPSGVLLVGPPGTGKTLLARAVAGEAGVPFFSLSGSDFAEVYVGVGARRVRDLFAKAAAAERRHGGAIVFIDELDACGRARGSGPSNGASEERESTLNQLLVAMDGFDATSRVVVLAATNRPEILDPALTRPGRFDRQVIVAAPDRRGRTAILRIHTAATPLADDVDLDLVARRCPGMTGAELANLVNQAAMAAARRQASAVSAADLDDALGRVVLGPERRSAIVSDHDRAITAWHEAGHAVAALTSPDHDDPVAVSIVPRGAAGGVTWMGGSDQQFLTLRQARARLAVTMAGRAAEELLLGEDVTQGAASDFRAATDLARRMVADYGMSGLGAGCFDAAVLGGGEEAVFEAVRAELEGALGAARTTVGQHRALVEAVAFRLLDDETIDADGLRDVHDGRRRPAPGALDRRRPPVAARAAVRPGQARFGPAVGAVAIVRSSLRDVGALVRRRRDGALSR